MTKNILLVGGGLAVLGLARSGLAAARALAAGGAEILAWDDNPGVRETVAAEIPLADLGAVDWREIPALVLSPGRLESMAVVEPDFFLMRIFGQNSGIQLDRIRVAPEASQDRRLQVAIRGIARINRE